jgi:hypothetical protein
MNTSKHDYEQNDAIMPTSDQHHSALRRGLFLPSSLSIRTTTLHTTEDVLSILDSVLEIVEGDFEEALDATDKSIGTLEGSIMGGSDTDSKARPLQ